MLRWGRPTLFFCAATFAVLSALLARPVRADEEDDIQRQIEAQRAGVPDLEHLDSHHAATNELRRLREWVGAAWDLKSKHDPDGAREILDRCLSQAELVRQIIAASQAKADLDAREAKLKKTRDEIERQKQALREGESRKKALAPVLGS